MYQFLKFVFGMKLYMFRTVPLFTVRAAMLYVIQVCWQLRAGSEWNILILLTSIIIIWNSTCFRQFLCPLSGVFHCTHSNGICHTLLLTAVSKPVFHCTYSKPLLYVQWKTPDDGQRNCLKHVEFHSKNKFEKLVHLVGLIIGDFYHYSYFVELSSICVMCCVC
jgi:hypothetical protein